MSSQSRPRAVKDHCELKKAAVKLVLSLASRLPDQWGGGGGASGRVCAYFHHMCNQPLLLLEYHY